MIGPAGNRAQLLAFNFQLPMKLIYDSVQILIAAPREIDQDHLILPHVRGALDHLRHGVSRLQGRDDPLRSCISSEKAARASSSVAEV